MTQYGWLCLCHFLDLEPSRALSPPVRRILRNMAQVAFEAVGHKKRFKLLTHHVLPSRPLYTPRLQFQLFRNDCCRCTLLADCVRICGRHATRPPPDMQCCRPEESTCQSMRCPCCAPGRIGEKVSSC